MSTHYSLYRLGDGQDSSKTPLIGVQTFENKKKCFTWHMNPGEFIILSLTFRGSAWGVVNEYGKKMTLAQFLEILRGIDIMRYDRDQPLELDQAEGLAAGEKLPVIGNYLEMTDQQAAALANDPALETWDDLIAKLKAWLRHAERLASQAKEKGL